MTNLQELLDSLDIFRKVTGLRSQDIYNHMLRRGWTLGAPQLMKVLHSIIRVYHPKHVELLDRYWRGHAADLIVSMVPNFNRAMFHALRAAMPAVPMVTILTDFADFPPHFWIERDQAQYFICGTDRAYRQARDLGHPPERLFKTSGMILSPGFYATPEVDRAAMRQSLGLQADLPTVLLMFGGEGSRRMVDIAKALDASDLRLQIIAIAGKNQRLEATLRALKMRLPMRVEGFTREVPKLMRIADVFIGKPGPGSISEAVAMGLPVLVEKNMWTLPQERYNAEWVEESGVGFVVENFKTGVVEAVRRVLDPSKHAELRTALARRDNRAVFEIPEILQTILTRG